MTFYNLQYSCKNSSAKQSMLNDTRIEGLIGTCTIYHSNYMYTAVIMFAAINVYCTCVLSESHNNVQTGIMQCVAICLTLTVI